MRDTPANANAENNMETTTDANVETKIAELTAKLIDENGDLRPIERIEFEPIGRSVRYTLWSGGRRLQTVTAPSGDLVGLLKATQIFLAIATNDVNALSTAGTKH